MHSSHAAIPVLFAAALLSAVGFAGELSIRPVADSVVDPEALHFTGGTWGNCVNGQAFQQDALATCGDWQYAVYYDAQRRVCVGRRRHGSPRWEVLRFPDYRIDGNDTHNVAVLGICPGDGTIHLAFDHHGDSLHYRVSKPGVALRPEEFAWTPELFGEIASQLEKGKALTRVTYPRFVQTPDGRLQFGCRIGGSGNGDKRLADYDPSRAAWSRFGAYAGGSGTYQNSRERNAYLNGLTYDRAGRLHATWCWRETGDPMTNHDLNYAWSRDGGITWLNNAGKPIGVRGAEPITLDSPGVRVQEIGMHRGLMNTTTQAVDRQGRIHVVTFHLPVDAPQQPDWETTRRQSLYFHYWRDDAGRWRRHNMGFMGGRPQLWFDESDNAYLVFTGDRFHPIPQLTIAAAGAETGWTDWTISHREEGPFTGQPQLDRSAPAGLLSVYVQEAPREEDPSKSPLHVIDFRPSSPFAPRK